MSRIRVPVTKSALLRLRADLDFLQAGRDLLEQKREYLSEALLTFDRDARDLRERVEKDLEGAYDLLAEAHAANGPAGLDRLALAAGPLRLGAVRERSLMGVSVPLVQDPADEDPGRGGMLRCAAGEGEAAAEQAASRLRRLAPAIATLAELEVCCRRLAQELVRTRRKLNALEAVHIPSHRETIRFIADQLEEREREGLFQLKRVAGDRGERP